MEKMSLNKITRIKRWIGGVILCCICFILSFDVKAANSKEMSVTIDETYSAIKVTMTLQTDIDFTAVLVDPLDTDYTIASKPTRHSAVFMISDPVQGEWTLYIESQDNIGDVNVSITPIEKKDLDTESFNKSINFEIEKDYASAKFTFAPETNIDGSLILVSPKGESTTVSKSDDGKTFVCVVNKVIRGTWTIKATATEEIGKIGVTIEGASEEAQELDSDIKIATDIAGLSLYFKDNSLVVDWTDETCGSVLIRVANAITLQILDSKTVKEQSYELALPDNVEEILVYVVPSTSANIDGAGVQYTLKVENNPAATVQFEDRTVTNQISTPVNIELSAKYRIELYANGKICESTEFLNQGSYSFNIPVNPGNNDYICYVIDEEKNRKSYTYSVTGDMVAPELTVNDSSKYLTVSSDTYMVSGSVKDYMELTVNGHPVENYYDDDTFEYQYTLREGENSISVQAVDEAGNISEQIITINFDPSIVKRKIITGGCLLAVAVLLVLIGLHIQKRKKSMEEESDIEKEERADLQMEELPKNLFRYLKWKKELSKKNPTAEPQNQPTGKEEKRKNIPIKKEVTEKEEGKKKEKNSRIEPVDFRGKHNFFISLCVLVVVILVIFKCLISINYISSGSMEPTLMTGDITLYNRLAYVNSDVQRGDIILFKSDEIGAFLVKRVIGIPGDVISFQDGYVIRNGEMLDESAYIAEDSETNCDKQFEVPEGCYLVLGDNREESGDSRFFLNPYIPQNCVKGKYIGAIGLSIK